MPTYSHYAYENNSKHIPCSELSKTSSAERALLYPGLFWKSSQQTKKNTSQVECIDDLPPVLHVKDLTSLLSISHNTAYALVRSGQIRSIRIGRAYRIPRDAVAEYLYQC